LVSASHRDHPTRLIRSRSDLLSPARSMSILEVKTWDDRRFVGITSSHSALCLRFLLANLGVFQLLDAEVFHLMHKTTLRRHIGSTDGYGFTREPITLGVLYR